MRPVSRKVLHEPCPQLHVDAPPTQKRFPGINPPGSRRNRREARSSTSDARNSRQRSQGEQRRPLLSFPVQRSPAGSHDPPFHGAVGKRARESRRIANRGTKRKIEGKYHRNSSTPGGPTA